MIVQPIGFLNTAVPLVLLMAGGLVAPRLFIGRATLSHWDVGRGMLFSAALLTGFGVALLAVMYQWGGSDVWGAFLVGPGATLVELLRVSFKASLFWAPVLAVVWFSLAQGVERRRGEELARKGR
jgi:hypothetical protein